MTHDEKVLALLADGRPHSHSELYNLHVIAHSRVASLRRKGYRIACEKKHGGYVYTLLKEGSAAPNADLSLSGGHTSGPLADGYRTAAAQQVGEGTTSQDETPLSRARVSGVVASPSPSRVAQIAREDESASLPAQLTLEQAITNGVNRGLRGATATQSPVVEAAA